LTPTRRDLVLATGAAFAAAAMPSAARAAGSFLAWHGKTGSEHAKLRADALARGYCCLSLSIYGPPAAPLYAAVMIKRPMPVAQREYPLLKAAELARTLENEAKQGFGAVVLGAIGTAADARFVLVVEPQGMPSLVRTGLTSGKPNDPASFEAANLKARIDRLIPRWVASYGAAGDPRFAGVWSPNDGRAIWNADGGLEVDADLQQRIAAQRAGWRRPILLAPNPDGRALAVFVDSQAGSWQARHALNEAQYQQEFDALTAQGSLPICVQAAGGSARAARFSAVFVQRETPVEKVFTARGPVANADIDNVLMNAMMAQPLRQASLAIVKGTRLVYARGYTYAEPDWPLAEPTTLFRLASVSKTVTALAAFQLIEEGKLKLTDRMQDILALTTPHGTAPADPRFREITVAHLLEHVSGLNPNAFGNDVAIFDAFKAARPGQPFALPVNAAMVDSYIASLKLADNPGAKAEYNNCGYYLLARIVGKLRRAATPIAAIQQHLCAPLKITRIRASRAPVASQLPDEARYGASGVGKGANARLDIPVFRSVMSSDRPLAPVGYGQQNYEIREGSGGLSGAATDLARLIAVWISPNDTPALKRETVKAMLDQGIANAGRYKNRSGYGLDATANRPNGTYYGQKGGDLATSQNVLQFNGEWGFVLNWASHVTDIGLRWYPNFPEVMNIATRTNWGATDLFPEFGMPSLSAA